MLAGLEKSVGDINNNYQSIQDYFNDIDGFLIKNDRETKPVKEANEKLQRSLKNYLLSLENDCYYFRRSLTVIFKDTVFL